MGRSQGWTFCKSPVVGHGGFGPPEPCLMEGRSGDRKREEGGRGEKNNIWHKGLFFEGLSNPDDSDQVRIGERKEQTVKGEGPYWEICGGLAQGKRCGLVD